MASKFKNFKKFVESVNEDLKNSQIKLQTLRSYLDKKPIDIIKTIQDGDQFREVINNDLVISLLPYDEMVTKEQKKLIGPTRYQAIISSFLEGLDHSLQLKQHVGLEWDNLFAKDIQDLFLDHIRTHYNIYASFPEVKEPRE